MPNHLAQETSPYLLQHADNPVDWYPWCPEALARAQGEDKPIFLSIGYSACHWCHVMEQESFEDVRIAEQLNADFIAIKVDREERPDLDQIYMHALQLMTERGGWPMSLFLTPDLKPFYGGTYWPARARMGMPGFDHVLAAVRDAWQNRREQAVAQADQLTEHLQQLGPVAGSGREPQLQQLWDAEVGLRRSGDPVQGGFGGAPKFPHAMALQLLMRVWHRRRNPEPLDLARLNLDKMAQGGIYDHVGGGFARYSVDARWLVPHFEKMLYDNALLADAYLDGLLITKDPRYERVVRETLDYCLDWLADEQGGFHSSEDADSEGEEGKFYLWSRREILAVLGPAAGERFCYVYDVTESGNFEQRNILNLPKPVAQCARLKGWDSTELEAELRESLVRLRRVREQRTRPAKDDKVLANWNGLLIHTLARAGSVLDSQPYRQAAAAAARFILSEMRRPDGRLLHSWRLGRARCDACLDDYATLLNALITLYESDFDERWIDEAVSLADDVLVHFRDPRGGGFYYTANDHEPLIARHKELYDNATPSSNATLAIGLLRLGQLCGRTSYREAVEEILNAGQGVMERSALAGAQLLIALDMYLGPTLELAVLGPEHDGDTHHVLRCAHQLYLPNRVLAYRPAATATADTSRHLDTLFAGKSVSQPSPALYVCADFGCQEPVRGRTAAEQQLRQLAELEHR